MKTPEREAISVPMLSKWTWIGSHQLLSEYSTIKAKYFQVLPTHLINQCIINDRWSPVSSSAAATIDYLQSLDILLNNSPQVANRHAKRLVKLVLFFYRVSGSVAKPIGNQEIHKGEVLVTRSQLLMTSLLRHVDGFVRDRELAAHLGLNGLEYLILRYGKLDHVNVLVCGLLFMLQDGGHSLGEEGQAGGRDFLIAGIKDGGGLVLE